MAYRSTHCGYMEILADTGEVRGQLITRGGCRWAVVALPGTPLVDAMRDVASEIAAVMRHTHPITWPVATHAADLGLAGTGLRVDGHVHAGRAFDDEIRRARLTGCAV